MIDQDLSYEAQLQDYCLAYELLKRKLRTSYVSQLINSIRLPVLRDIHRSLHNGESPKSGLLPAIDAMPQLRESLLYMSLFASLYRSASQVDIRTEMDVPAIIFAWDFFCETFPNQIHERRPFGKVRPANFNEAWVIAQALTIGLAALHYCESCHGEYIVIYNSKFPPTCQICVMDNLRKTQQQSVQHLI